MKKIIIISVLILTTALFAFSSRYIRMRKVGSQSINYQWSKCYYKSNFNQGFGTIAITVQGGTYSCPYSIKYYPASGAWTK